MKREEIILAWSGEEALGARAGCTLATDGSSVTFSLLARLCVQVPLEPFTRSRDGISLYPVPSFSDPVNPLRM